MDFLKSLAFLIFHAKDVKALLDPNIELLSRIEKHQLYLDTKYKMIEKTIDDSFDQTMKLLEQRLALEKLSIDDYRTGKRPPTKGAK